MSWSARASQSVDVFCWLGKHTWFRPEDKMMFFWPDGPGGGLVCHPSTIASKSKVDCILSTRTPIAIGAELALMPTSCRLLATKLEVSTRWLLLAFVMRLISTV